MQIPAKSDTYFKISEHYVFDQKDKIGQGNFGSVYRGYSTKHKKTIAVKIIFNNSIKQLNEISNMMKLRNDSCQHPGIMGYYDSFIINKSLYMILQYCQNNSVEIYVQNGRIDEISALKILKQCLEALSFMNRKNLIHRDIKPGNILLDENNNAKLGDFGLTKQISITMTIGAGTPIYSAPQTRTQDIYNEKCDIWSLGVTIYQILTGQLLFDPKVVKTQERLIEWHKKWRDGELKLKISADLDENWQKIIKYMLIYDYNLRPSAQQVLKFVQKIQPSMNLNIETKYGIKKQQKNDENQLLAVSQLISSHIPNGLHGQRISQFEKQEISYHSIGKAKQFLIFSRLKSIIPSLLPQQLMRNKEYQIQVVYKNILIYISLKIALACLQDKKRKLELNETDTPFGKFSLQTVHQKHRQTTKQILQILLKSYQSQIVSVKRLLNTFSLKYRFSMNSPDNANIVRNIYANVPSAKDILSSEQQKDQQCSKYIEVYKKICSLPGVYISNQDLRLKSQSNLRTYSYIRLLSNLDTIFSQKYYQRPNFVRSKRNQINSLTGEKRLQFIMSINSRQ